jgi:Adenylate kinase and related kinases
MLNVVIFGAPGSGKGTQSELIIAKYGLHHISMGEILREEMEKQTELGQEAAKSIEKGQLISDEVVIKILGDILDNHSKVKGFIFDGFPRTLAQGEALDKMLKKKGLDVTIVLSLSVDEDELVQRLLKRGELSGRSDDKQEVIKNRLNVYREQTEPLKEYYRKRGKLYSIKGTGTIEDIFENIAEALDRLIL